MKKEEQICRDLTELVRLTQEGKQTWDVQCQTTEYNDPKEKPVEIEDGEEWLVDECFVAYHCFFHEKEFLLITYEQIFTCGEKQKTCNLVFAPPLGIRFFDVDILAPYALTADQMLLYSVHMLWQTILEQYRKHPEQIQLDAFPRTLVFS